MAVVSPVRGVSNGIRRPIRAVYGGVSGFVIAFSAITGVRVDLLFNLDTEQTVINQSTINFNFSEEV